MPASMPHRFTITYSEAMVRQAVLGFWRRTAGTGFLVALLVLGASFAFLLWSGDRSWLVGALGTCLGVAVAIAALVYVIHLRRSLAKFRAMGTPVATLELDDASLCMSSSIGNSSIQWSAITELWRFQSFWLLLFSKAQFVTLPLSCVPQEAQAFILGKIKATGARVDP
jgi:hypothetical protein